jgi:hypothetical protein
MFAWAMWTGIRRQDGAIGGRDRSWMFSRNCEEVSKARARRLAPREVCVGVDNLGVAGAGHAGVGMWRRVDVPVCLALGSQPMRPICIV